MPKEILDADLSLKPRVLIADDSRIVRATLTKHIQGMFEFREALDGEQAWETLLLDPRIRVLITDLTMPKLDGYGLLERIRSSKISRIRNMPVVVVSGSDEQRERDRVMAAGATDLITKGIGTAQLLSRLDILSNLIKTQDDYEQGLEALIKQGADPAHQLASPYVLQTQAETMLSYAVQHKKNFVLFNMSVGLRGSAHARLTDSVVAAIGQLLKRTIRQSDTVARTGATEFTLATGSINSDAARGFASRLCSAIANAKLMEAESAVLVACCGLASLQEPDGEEHLSPTLNSLWDVARRRSLLGLEHGWTGVVGMTEEKRFMQVGMEKSRTA
jgi:two-component system, cell cycle response regulator